MPGIDKTAMRAQAHAALQSQQAPAPAAPAQAAPAPAQSLADRATTQVAQAAAAAAGGQPGAAQAAQPSQPVAPGRPASIEDRIAAAKAAVGDKFPVRFNHETVELPVAEVQRFAQLGMAAEDLRAQREALKADKSGYEGYQAFRRWVEQDTTGMRARLLQDAYTGRVDPARIYAQDGDDDLPGNTSPAGDTRGHTSQGDPATQARLEQLERQLAQFRQQTDQRTFEQRLDSSLNSHDYLRDDPVSIQIAREIVMGRLAAEDFSNLDSEVARAASRVKALTDAKLDAVRERREQQAQEFVPVTPGRGPALPKLPDNLLSGTRGMRSQQNKSAVKDWLASFGRAASSGPS